MARVISAQISNIQNDFLTAATLLKIDNVHLTDYDKDIAGSDLANYQSTGILLSHASITETSALTVGGIDITLSGASPTIVSFLLGDPHINRPVNLKKVILNDDNIVVTEITYFDGTINSFTIEEQADTSEITLNCSSHWSDFERTNGRRTNDVSQQDEFAGDKGMEFAAVMIDDIKWGKK